MLDKDTSLNGSMHHSTFNVLCDGRQNSNHHYTASLISPWARLRQLGTTVHLQFKQVMPVKSGTVRQSNYIMLPPQKTINITTNILVTLGTCEDCIPNCERLH